jgi:hypothetical protein
MENNMTFTLKDFAALKKHFNDTVTVFLKRDDKDSIDEIRDNRKEELFFLKSVLDDLESRIAKSHVTNLKPYADIFAGAMLVIKQHVKANLGMIESEDHSKLFKRLEDALVSTQDKEPPSLYQLASYYKALNGYLSVLYSKGDSRLGLKVSSVFDGLPLSTLASIVTISYSEEERVRNEIAKKYSAGGSAEPKLYRDYKFPKATPETAVEKFGGFDKLKKSLDDLILEQFAKKTGATLAELPNKTRASQLHTLEKLAGCLASSSATMVLKEPERTAILAGAMLLVREQIGLEYKKPPFSLVKVGSNVHQGLTGILNIDKTSREDAQALIAAAQNFIAYMTLERTEAKGVVVESVKSKHIFSEVVGTGFNLVSVMNLMNSLIKFCRIDVLVNSVKARQAALDAAKPKEAGAGFLGMGLNPMGWFGKKKAAAVEAEEEEHDDEKDDEKSRDKDDQKSFSPTNKSVA